MKNPGYGKYELGAWILALQDAVHRHDFHEQSPSASPANQKESTANKRKASESVGPGNPKRRNLSSARDEVDVGHPETHIDAAQVNFKK